MKRRITIETEQQLINCVYSKVDVEVWVGGVFDCLSRVTGYTAVVVTLEDGKYLRGNCIIKAKGNYF